MTFLATSQRLYYRELDWQSCMREVNRLKSFHYYVGFKNRNAIKLECCSWSRFAMAFETWKRDIVNLTSYIGTESLFQRWTYTRTYSAKVGCWELQLDVECVSGMLKVKFKCRVPKLIFGGVGTPFFFFKKKNTSSILYSPSIVHYIKIHSTWYTRYGRRSSKLYWAFLKIPTKLQFYSK